MGAHLSPQHIPPGGGDVGDSTAIAISHRPHVNQAPLSYPEEKITPDL